MRSMTHIQIYRKKKNLVRQFIVKVTLSENKKHSVSRDIWRHFIQKVLWRRWVNKSK